MERISIVGMNAFAQVVETGSFAAAAGRLQVSPATITHHISTLETYLGTRLLNRTTRTVSLTESGAIFYDHCRHILAEIEEAERATTALSATPRGVLRINASPVLARLVTPALVEYAAVYPDVSFELITSDRLLDIVGEKYDLALRTDPLPDSSLMARSIGLGRLVLCASPKYLESHGTPELPSELSNHNCMTYVNTMVGARWRFTRDGTEEFIDVSGNLRTNSIEGMRAAACAGNGVCLLPTFTITEDFRRGRLMPLLTDFFSYEAAIHAVFPARKHMSSKVRTFLDFIVKTWDEKENAERLFPMVKEIAQRPEE